MIEPISSSIVQRLATFSCSAGVSVRRIDCSCNSRISRCFFSSFRRKRSEAQLESALIIESALPCALRRWELVTKGTSVMAWSADDDGPADVLFCSAGTAGCSSDCGDNFFLDPVMLACECDSDRWLVGDILVGVV